MDEQNEKKWHERMNEYGERRGWLERDTDGDYQLTDAATERQDAVDSALVDFANRMIPFGSRFCPDSPDYLNGEMVQELAYEGDWAGDLRDTLMESIWKALHLEAAGADRDEFEMDFYPYVADDGGEPGESSSTQTANVVVCLSDPMHERHRPELARNILNALVREAQSNMLAPEGAEGDEDTGGYTQRIRVFVGDALAEEDLARP